MTHLYQALATKVDEWRHEKYPCDDYPAICEILEYAVEDDETGQLRYLRRAQFEIPPKIPSHFLPCQTNTDSKIFPPPTP